MNFGFESIEGTFETGSEKMDNIKTIPLLSLSKEELKNPICIQGMPGIADIGKFAVDQLIGLLKAKKFLEIIFNDYPAGAIIDNSLLSTPKAEILFWKDPKEKQDIFFITADAQAMSPKGIYEISDFLVKFLNDYGIQLIISLGAFPVKKSNSEPNVFITATTESRVLEFTSKYNCARVKKGVIIGANGLVPTLAQAFHKIDGVVLLAETDNSALMNDDITDLNASVNLLKLIGKYLGLPLLDKFSPQKIQEMTKNLEIKKKMLEEEIETFQPIAETSEGQKSLYI